MEEEEEKHGKKRARKGTKVEVRVEKVHAEGKERLRDKRGRGGESKKKAREEAKGEVRVETLQREGRGWPGERKGGRGGGESRSERKLSRRQRRRSVSGAVYLIFCNYLGFPINKTN